MKCYRIGQAGFTLIELMIVITIIGVLSTLAVPSYQDRVIRAQVAEGMELAEFVSQGVADYYKQKARMPESNDRAGLPPADKIISNYVSSVVVEDGAIHITFGNKVNNYLAGKVLTLRPAIVEGYSAVPISWLCGHADGVETMKVMGLDKTDIPTPHLPMECRPG